MCSPSQCELVCPHVSRRRGNLQNSTQSRSPISAFGEAFKVTSTEFREQLAHDFPVTSIQLWVLLDLTESIIQAQNLSNLKWQKHHMPAQPHTYSTMKHRLSARSSTSCHYSSLNGNHLCRSWKTYKPGTLIFWVLSAISSSSKNSTSTIGDFACFEVCPWWPRTLREHIE